jgi:hypothetical protein
MNHLGPERRLIGRNDPDGNARRWRSRVCWLSLGKRLLAEGVRWSALTAWAPTASRILSRWWTGVRLSNTTEASSCHPYRVARVHHFASPANQCAYQNRSIDTLCLTSV